MGSTLGVSAPGCGYKGWRYTWSVMTNRQLSWPKVGYSSSSWLMLAPLQRAKSFPEKEMPELQTEARNLTPLALGCVKELLITI